MAYIERNLWRWTSAEAKKASQLPRKKQSSFPPYTRENLAEAIGVSLWSLNIYINKNKIPLHSLSLKQLNELINELKDKRPLNTGIPRYKSNKPIIIEDEDGEF